jgi:16S rRNA (guanine527-N7)-methyltransferase
VFGGSVASARTYTDWLVGPGVERGLIGPREADRIWTRHVLNCAVLASVIPQDATVVDVGSGAGLPGIPLAIARPDLQVTLVEPLARRTVFLDEVVAALELANVRVLRGRADEVVDRCGGADVVTSRAVAPLAKLMAWSAPLARVGGQILALKGASAGEEVERDRAAVSSSGVGELAVLTVGEGIVDPPTYVIRGVVRSAGRSGRKGGKPTAKQRRAAR